MDIRAGTIHPKSDPPDAGTKQLGLASKITKKGVYKSSGYSNSIFVFRPEDEVFVSVPALNPFIMATGNE